VDTFDLVAKDEGVEWEGDPSKWINVVEERLLRVVAAQAEVALRRLRPGQQE
jgi:hypothetical protein